jgi:hypothetical protein
MQPEAGKGRDQLRAVQEKREDGETPDRSRRAAEPPEKGRRERTLARARRPRELYQQRPPASMLPVGVAHSKGLTSVSLPSRPRDEPHRATLPRKTICQRIPLAARSRARPSQR